MLVDITDEPRARTRKKTLNYIREGDVLRHISNYAESEIETRDDKYLSTTYSVQFESIQGRTIYEYVFTQKGSFIVYRFSTLDLLDGNERNKEYVEHEELYGLEFEVSLPGVTDFIKEMERTYFPMISEINDYKEKIGIKHILASKRVSDYLEHVRYGLASSLCNWPEQARLKSLQNTSKLIHQLWTFKIAHETIGATKILNNHWRFKQASKYPASKCRNEKGEFWSFWYEPQEVKRPPDGYRGPITDFFEQPMVWKRPDLIFSKGEHNNLFEAPQFDLLIECKDFPFEKWWKNGSVISNDLLPYNTLFKPLMFVLASIHPVPDWAKSQMRKENIFVVDNFHTTGEGLAEFKNLLRGY